MSNYEFISNTFTSYSSNNRTDETYEIMTDWLNEMKKEYGDVEVIKIDTHTMEFEDGRGFDVFLNVLIKVW